MDVFRPKMCNVTAPHISSLTAPAFGAFGAAFGAFGAAFGAFGAAFGAFGVGVRPSQLYEDIILARSNNVLHQYKILWKRVLQSKMTQVCPLNCFKIYYN